MSIEEIKEEIKYWKEYRPVNNMGKWYVQVRLDSLNKKLNKLNEKKVLPNKGR
jgi:hypothetical protein